MKSQKVIMKANINIPKRSVTLTSKSIYSLEHLFPAVDGAVTRTYNSFHRFLDLGKEMHF